MHGTATLLRDRRPVNHRPKSDVELTLSFPVSLVKGPQNLLRPCPDCSVPGQVPPGDGSIAIEQEFRRSRDVFAFRSGAVVKQVILTDHFRFGIRKEWKGITHLATMTLAYLGRIDTDRRDSDASLLKIPKMMLETPQLGVTQ